MCLVKMKITMRSSSHKLFIINFQCDLFVLDCKMVFFYVTQKIIMVFNCGRVAEQLYRMWAPTMSVSSTWIVKHNYM